MTLAAVALAAVTLAALTLAAVTLAAVTLRRDPRCPPDIKRVGTVPRLNLNAVLLTSHPFIIVYLIINVNRSSHIFIFTKPKHAPWTSPNVEQKIFCTKFSGHGGQETPQKRVVRY